MRAAIILLMVGLLWGCTSSSGSQFVPTGRTDLKIPGTSSNKPILVIFTPGTSGNKALDPCHPMGGPWWGGQSVPEVLVRLAERNEDIFVYAHCTKVVGDGGSDPAEAVRVVPCQGGGSDKQTKMCKRIGELEELIWKFHHANSDLDAQRIFLAGTSGGAWSSLLALRARPDLANAVIGFAPAFLRFAERQKRGFQDLRRLTRLNPEYGPDPCQTDSSAECRQLERLCKRYRRLGPGYVVRCRQLDWIANPDRHNGRELPALVYGFYGDPHEDPNTLEPLWSTPGVVFVEQPRPGRALWACRPAIGGNAHSCNHRHWFAEEEYANILAYIRCRVGDVGDDCAQMVRR